MPLIPSILRGVNIEPHHSKSPFTLIETFFLFAMVEKDQMKKSILRLLEKFMIKNITKIVTIIKSNMSYLRKSLNKYEII